MSAKAVASKKLLDYSSSKEYSTATVTRLLELLGDASDDKENASVDAKSKPVAKSSKRAPKATLQERSNKVGASRAPKASSATIGIKDQKTLATDVVNGTIKILTAAVKVTRSAPDDEKSGVRKPQRSDANDTGHLTAVVICSSAAFRSLRRLQNGNNCNIQLEQGIIALTSKITTLGYIQHAFKELCALHGRLEQKSTDKCSGVRHLAESELLLVVGAIGADVEFSRLVVSYFHILLRLFTSSELSLSLSMCRKLEPTLPTGPAAWIDKLGILSKDTDELKRNHDQLTQSISLLARARKAQQHTSPEVIISLEIMAVRMKARSSIDDTPFPRITTGLIRSVRQSVVSYQSATTKNTKEQYDFVDALLAPLIESMSANDKSTDCAEEYEKLCVLMSDLEDRALGKESIAIWSSRSTKHKTSPALLHAVKALRTADLPESADFESALSIFEGQLSAKSSITIDDGTLHIINKTCNHLMATKYQQMSPDQALATARIVQLLVKVRLSSGDARDDQSDDKSILQTGIFSCNHLILRHAPAGPLVLQSLQLLQQLSLRIAKTDNGPTFLALSNLLERVACSVSAKSADEPPAAYGELLQWSVHSLHGLPDAQRDQGHVLRKVVALATHHHRMGYNTRAVAHLATAFNHVSSTQTFKRIHDKLNSHALSSILEAEPCRVHILAGLNLIRRIGANAKREVLVGALQSLPAKDAVVCSYLWLMCPVEADVHLMPGELNACVSRVLEHFALTRQDYRAMLVKQRALLFLIMNQAKFIKEQNHTRNLLHDVDDLESEYPTGGTGLTRYRAGTRALWLLTRLAFERSTSLCEYKDAFRMLRELIPSGPSSDALFAKFEDPYIVLPTLSIVFSELSLLQYRELQQQVVSLYNDTSQALAQPGNHSFAIHADRIRMALSSTDRATAELGLSALRQRFLESELPPHQALELYRLHVQVACSTQDPHQLTEAMQALASSTASKGLARSARTMNFLAQADTLKDVAEYSLQQKRFSLAALLSKKALLLYRSLQASAVKASASPDAPTTQAVTPDIVDEVVGGLQGLELEDSFTKQKTSLQSDEAGSSLTRRLLLSMWDGLLILGRTFSEVGMWPEAHYHISQAAKIGEGLGIPNVPRCQRKASLRLEYVSALSSSQLVSGRDFDVKIQDRQGNRILLAQLLITEGDWLCRFGDKVTAQATFSAARAVLPQAHSNTITPSQRHSNPQASKTSRRPAKRTGLGGIMAAKPTATRKANSNGRPMSKVITTIQPSSESLGGEKPDASPPQSEMTAKLIAEISVQSAEAYIKSLEFQQAAVVLTSAGAAAIVGIDTNRVIAATRICLAQVKQQLLSNVQYSSLSESTISLPAAAVISGALDSADAGVFKDKKRVLEDQQVILKSDSAALPVCAKYVVQEILNAGRGEQSFTTLCQLSSLSVEIALISSAISPASSLFQHPMMAAWALEMPSIMAHRSLVGQVGTEKNNEAPDECLRNVRAFDETHSDQPYTNFQADFLDILPRPWTVVSLSLNEDCTELWVAQYRSGQIPLFLRLPMTRTHDTGMEEETRFTYDAAVSELTEITRQSDYTCHNAPASSVKGGKSRWWAEREALDERLHELLVNMERIWFGGFRGILSLQRSQVEALARFRKSFDSILSKHLPSRQGLQSKSKKAGVSLHSHVLSLFVGLCEQESQSDNLDEDVTDLLYYVVDILQWHGEANAYDEIDFDAMAVETIDAIKAYHDLAGVIEACDRHLILRLDKRLHGFPWESMPCLQGMSVSRVESLLHIRERLLEMRSHHRGPPASFQVSRRKGSFIINPSGDLKRTEETLSPRLEELSHSADWSAYIGMKPDEHAFSATLQSSDITLYFGHGSATQYIRERTVRKLDRCSKVVWLMGCSSGTVTQYGDFRCTSVPLTYLLAGQKEDSLSASDERQGMCMAVVATLWDVTDRDIDRFSLTVGENWGLFKAAVRDTQQGNGRQTTPDVQSLAQPKTPGKRGKSVPKTPKSALKGPSKTPRRNAKTKMVEDDMAVDEKAIRGPGTMSLPGAVAQSRNVCYLRYLNGAASVVYGVPVYLEAE